MQILVCFRLPKALAIIRPLKKRFHLLDGFHLWNLGATRITLLNMVINDFVDNVLTSLEPTPMKIRMPCPLLV